MKERSYAQEKAAKKQADRGKASEEAVQKYLTVLGNGAASFDWNRQYDARAAGGRFPSQPGDFQYFRSLPPSLQGDEPWTVNGLIEVKELKTGQRLPHKNFERIAPLRKRELAGTKIHVIVWFEELQAWAEPAFKIFKDDPAATSWDLSRCLLARTLKELFWKHEALRYHGKD